ncbi:MAG: hypothetical protein AB7R69_02115 [Candidatus Babeliales bacterium]
MKKIVLVFITSLWMVPVICRPVRKRVVKTTHAEQKELFSVKSKTGAHLNSADHADKKVDADTASRKLVDKVEAIVHGPERSQIFCKSDQARRGIDGRTRTLEDSITEELFYQEAIRYKIPIDDNVVKQHLEKTLQGFGLKSGDEYNIFAQEGYTYQEGFERFRLMYANNVMVDYKVRQGMLIPEDEVISYYNKHPIEKQPKYQLQMSYVSDRGNKKETNKKLEEFVQTGKGFDIQWSDPYWLLEQDIAEGLEFITAMEPGAIKKQKVSDGFQLFQLKAKKSRRFVSLKKRYRDIMVRLQKPKFEETFEKYRKSLFDAATIVHM